MFAPTLLIAIMTAGSYLYVLKQVPVSTLSVLHQKPGRTRLAELHGKMALKHTAAVHARSYDMAFQCLWSVTRRMASHPKNLWVRAGRRCIGPGTSPQRILCHGEEDVDR